MLGVLGDSSRRSEPLQIPEHVEEAGGAALRPQAERHVADVGLLRWTESNALQDPRHQHERSSLQQFDFEDIWKEMGERRGPKRRRLLLHALRVHRAARSEARDRPVLSPQIRIDRARLSKGVHVESIGWLFRATQETLASR